MKRCLLLSPIAVGIVLLLSTPPFSAMVAERAAGEQRVLVIMAKFPDVHPSFSAENLRVKYFDKLDRYLKAVSHYLIENRQPIGPDRNIPSHGVLIAYCDDRVAECRHGKSPVKLANADPSIPQLKGAPLRLEGKKTFIDAKNKVTVKLLARRGDSYRVHFANGD